MIIGDLFEAWPGDDWHSDCSRRVGQALQGLVQSGTQVGLMHGNRDFLLGEAFCQRWGIAMLDQPLLLPFRQGQLVVLHGDQLCTDDAAYQRWRNKVRGTDWQQRVLSRPLWWRLALAKLARGVSRLRHVGRRQTWHDVNDQAVLDTLNQYQAQAMVHGHTHAPQRHRHDLGDGQWAERMVLSDWTAENGSAIRLTQDQHGADQLVLLKVIRDGQGASLLDWPS